MFAVKVKTVTIDSEKEWWNTLTWRRLLLSAFTFTSFFDKRQTETMAMIADFDVPSLFQPRQSAISVIDPELKQYGRVWLSMERLEPTNGLARHLSGHPYPLSLCLLFQKQRCRHPLFTNVA